MSEEAQIDGPEATSDVEMTSDLALASDATMASYPPAASGESTPEAAQKTSYGSEMVCEEQIEPSETKKRKFDSLDAPSTNLSLKTALETQRVYKSIVRRLPPSKRFDEAWSRRVMAWFYKNDGPGGRNGRT